MRFRGVLLVWSFVVSLSIPCSCAVAERVEKHLLYAAVPGIRNDLSYGGEGILVFDIDHDHKYVKRIPTRGQSKADPPEPMKGVCANARTKRLYFSCPSRLVCVDLVTDRIVWERSYESGCDRMSMTPDGKMMYLPTGDWSPTDYWYAIDGASGDVVQRIHHKIGTHNTVCDLDGSHAYLASLKCSELAVVDTKTNTISSRIGPFSDSIRPFTVNGRGTLCYVTVNDLLGFEIGDLRTGKMLASVAVPGYKKGPTKRHGCPSHGVGLTPDEKEIWLTDATNARLHLFDSREMPPRYVTSIKLSDEPGWITFSIDGRYAYPSTGDIIDVKTRRIIGHLKDETGRAVQSEKMLEIDFSGDEPVRAGDQFGIGRVTGNTATAPAGPLESR